jgi:metal-responsive CopG/Arc/MetJ family transcriptional regulator
MEDIKRIAAGVMFESDVLGFIDRMAWEQRRSRSYIINHLVRLYARQQKPVDSAVTQQEEKTPREVIRF